MKSIKELKSDLALAKTDEAYHRKQMEYQQEQIKILENQIKEQDDPNVSMKQRLGRIVRDSNTAVVKCQVCAKNDVVIQKDTPYFGIICRECLSKNTIFTNDKKADKLDIDKYTRLGSKK